MRSIVVLSFVLLCVFGITALLLDNDHFADLCLEVNSTQTKECTNPTDGTLLCYNHIPEDPRGFTAVVIAMCNIIDEDININENYFINSDWTSVKRFSFTKTELVNTKLNIGAFAFRRMTNLQSLHIHNRQDRTSFVDNSFCGLETLKEMSFTGSKFLEDRDLLIFFSSNCSLPNIESLSLSNTKIKDILFNRTLIMLMLRRRLKVLDIQSLQLRCDVHNLAENFDTIEELYLQNSALDGGGRLVHAFPNLHILDLSGTYASFSNIFCLSSRLKINKDQDISAIKVFRSVRTLIWDKVCRNTDLSKPKDLYFDNLTTNLSLDLKHFFLRDNNINSITGSFNWPNNNVEHIDLTNNNISYLSPNIISAFKTLKVLVLNRNELYRMSESHSDEFELLFQVLPVLDTIQLSRNKFVVIPKNTFTNNLQLRVLDLSFNQLKIVNFTITKLKQLESLDLSGNQIKYSDAITQFVLTDFIRMYNSTKTHIMRAVQVSTCSKCDDLDDIQWLVTNQDIFNDFQNISCTLESGQTSELTTDVLNNIHDVCYRPTRIIKSVVIPIAVIIILLPVLIVIVKVIKNRFREKLLRFNEHKNVQRWQNWKHGEDTYEFPVFLSFASQDKELAKHICNKLNNCLQQKIGTRRDMVFFSDLHMLAGSIMAGIKIAVERSTSIMFVIADANAFGQSEWCIHEFNIAIKMKRHIFIMVTDDLNLDELPTEFKSTFRDTARIILKRTPTRRLRPQHARNENGVTSMQLSPLAGQLGYPSFDESDNDGDNTPLIDSDGEDDPLLNLGNQNHDGEGVPYIGNVGNDGHDVPLLIATENKHAWNVATGLDTCIREANDAYTYECDTVFEVEGIHYELQTSWENVCAAIVRMN